MKTFLAAVLLVLSSCNISPSPGPEPGPTAVVSPAATPVVRSTGPLNVCTGKKLLCYEGKEVRLVGYSNYGAFSLPYDYTLVLDLLAQHKVNFLRQWATPMPRAWGGLAPYVFVEREPVLQEEFFKNADRYISLASQRGMWVFIDLVDRYGVDKPVDFATNPLNWANGGPLKNGLPDLYTSPTVLRMVEKTIIRLSKHTNVLYQVCNEPVGGTRTQVDTFHKEVIKRVRQLHPGALVAINPVPDRATNRPTVPMAIDVGADFVTIHGAGVEDITKPKSCSVEVLRERLMFIQSWQGVPVIADTDGLWNERAPCNRHDPIVLEQLFRASRIVAGFNHRDGEGQDELVDREALSIFSKDP